MIRLMVVRTRIEPVKTATPAGLEPKISLLNTVYTDQITDQYEPYWKKSVTPEVAGSSLINRIICDSMVGIPNLKYVDCMGVWV